MHPSVATASLSSLGKNEKLNTVALIITIAAGVFTIYHLFRQSKLTKLQIAQLEKQEIKLSK